MLTPMIGKITLFPYAYAPSALNLVLCNGSKFSISGHEGLYNLIGRRFGAGDDRNFVMPDLRAARRRNIITSSVPEACFLRDRDQTAESACASGSA